MKNIRRHLSARKNGGMAPQHLKRPRPKRRHRPAYCRAWPRTGNPYAKLTSVSHFGKDGRMPPIAGPEYDTISASVNKAAAIAKSALLIPAEMPSLKGSHHHELPELRKRICRRRKILRILRRAVGFRGKRTRRPRSPRSRIALQCPRAVDAHRHQHGTVERAAGSRANAIGLCALRAARAVIRHPKRLCCPQCQYAAGLLHPARSLATKPLPECIPSTVWPACVPRRIRWRDLPNVRFRSHIAPH